MHFLIRILRRMAVGQRLATGFGLVLVLMALLIGVALYGLSELHQLNMRLVEHGHVDGSSAKATVAAASSTLYDILRGAILGIGVLAALVAGFFSRRVAQMITRPISRAAAVADGIARGNLAQKIDVNHHGGELGALLHSLQNTIYRLRELIQAVRDRAEAVNNGTNEITRGNAELSSRTEQQASTLEQTAASIEEFTSSIKQNAENARRAKALAISTSEIATAGGRAVSNAVDTMNGISTSSKKISDIIGVIDGIAFQTNILALNAAVEAARAGDQGRGFAVVASEVRTLAQRSATAAKQIKVLISDSVEKINAGGTLVTEAGNTMVEVVESVKRMTDMVNQIADASREQASGIDQVNHAIVHMDQSTQQNAALVEQVSATAQTMTAQVHAMMQAVGAFNLGELVLQPTFERGFRRADEKPDTATTDMSAARASPPVATLPAFVRRVSARDAGSGDSWKAV